ncbi:MAG: hypothetical protein RL173_2364 [Fibrobacterota bacterium]|jgi:peptidoglycan/xylan/chitin deacetylase (PgdA/CDA1 family)
MHHRPIVKKLLVGLVLSATALTAGPITTVPWNGYAGAATFTFDDGMSSQVTTLMPALRTRKVNATMFVYNSSGWQSSKAGFVTGSKAGDEIANHTQSHPQNPPTDATSLNNEIVNWAKTLRGTDPSIEAVTFAYPYCASNAAEQAVINQENFIARNCSSESPYTWNTNSEPTWMNMQSYYMSGDANQTAANTALDKAKNNGWFTLLFHDVGGSNNNVTPSVVFALIDRAISNKLWVATYAQVGAYWRAAFAMDKVTATGSGPWNLTWTSPHAKLPKSVKLKVKLAAATFGSSFTVSQDNVAIPANSDGSYTIDFMKLKLAVTTGSSGVSRASGLALGGVSLRRTASEIVMTGIGSTGFDMTVRNLNGRILASKHVEARSDVGTENLALDPTLAGSPVLAVISATDGSALRSIPLAPVR